MTCGGSRLRMGSSPVTVTKERPGGRSLAAVWQLRSVDAGQLLKRLHGLLWAGL